MTTADLIALLAILAQTGALFYWGGRVNQMLKDHDRRLTVTEQDVQRLERHSRSTDAERA